MLLNMLKNDEVIGQIRAGERADFPDNITVCPGFAGWKLREYSLEEADPMPLLSTEERVRAERDAMVATRFQTRAALMLMGHLSDVEAYIENAEPIVKIAWQDATEFKRTSKTLNDVAEAIGLSQEQLDELFETAITLEA